MNNVEFPTMRAELAEYLWGLGEPTYQRQVWVKGEPWGHKKHGAFDYAVHFLFDDTSLAEDPKSTIGQMLLNETEADRVADVVAAIEAIFQKYGTRLSDAEYIALPEWSHVVQAAKAAAALIHA